MNYTLECVWKAVPEALRIEAADFWLAEGALKDRQAALERAERLVILARDGQGHIAAVSTARREVVVHFGFSMFVFQLFIGRRHRRPGLAQALATRAWTELDARFAAGESRDTLGLMIEVAHEKAAKLRREAVWRDNGMEFVYCGKSARGLPLRVWYFRDARIPV